MEYFRMKQDPAYLHAPVIPDVIKQIDRRDTMPDEAHSIDEATIFQLSGKEQHDFLDLLDRQLFMVSEPLKEIMQLYVPELNFKTVVLTKPAQMQVYYLPIFTQVDCLSDQSSMTPDKSGVKPLVLRHEPIKRCPLFCVKHARETIIIARLDVAESILRRKFRGVKLQRVSLE
jgi:hypothetical protein